MPKALCWTGIVIAGVLCFFFLIDVVVGWPFQRASGLMDLIFVGCSAALGYLSWSALRDQD